MLRTRTSLTAVLAVATVVAFAGCGGDSPSADPTGPPATQSDDTGTAAPEESDGTDTPAPTDEGEPPAAEVTVTVDPLIDGNDQSAAMFEQYALFETAFWQSLATGEVSPELRALVSPDAMVGIEQGIAGQPHPIGGSVTVRPSLDDLTIADVGFGMTLTEAVIAGCSDQTQLQYDGGATGASATITANVSLEPEGYLITNYTLGPPAC